MNRTDVPTRVEHSDRGNAAVELLAVALIGGIATVTLSTGLFSAQRDSFAAEQLAREAVRLEVLRGQDPNYPRALIANTSQELKLSPQKISIEYERSGNILRVKATVNGQTSTAAMRDNK